MPLSEQEQRLLEEMERNLYQNDADFVATVSGPRGRPNYTQIVLGSLMAIAGVVALIVGVNFHPLIGVVGFALMLGGVLLALAPGRGSSQRAPSDSRPTPRPARSSFMDTINERWERRSNGGLGG
jgi:predicted phage tail protein